MSKRPRLATLLAPLVCAIAADSTAQAERPPGDDKTPKTRVLEAGAKALQRNTPLGPMDVYLVGFHTMKDDPKYENWDKDAEVAAARLKPKVATFGIEVYVKSSSGDGYATRRRSGVDGRAGSVTRRATRRVASLRTSTRAAPAPAAPTTGPWVTASG